MCVNYVKYLTINYLTIKTYLIVVCLAVLKEKKKFKNSYILYVYLTLSVCICVLVKI